MDAGKYNRSISMQCPTCGGTDFAQDDSSIVKCASCDREMTKDELREANGDRIQAELEVIKAEVMKDIRADFAKAFKKWK
ncbi:hypothetical protein CA223_07265 [Sphingomonas koreensis]|jgi:ribosomal protein L37AE/L43A|uniref:Uncharacterized protein n=1 Tax=Sphingomonas koreensis TaxID=93064 RepID=A0A1L6J7M8_9SPHN|nr:hypothetical protein [Sphingomonas koreensis]APR51915.1 hypothetical protein BRX40_05215 [Sphingomonas koreensis]MDC7812134.1 hypothetical protein [Sphingomonas koreensis]RSU21533.1 hypothetical protein CA224_08695 [Sphingomonas koreensis]RSU30808.1 hypothetical protein CA222_01710 [Sphingomonas koreensis]RSU31903.1 hypothetical protein CA225_00790 [Sphingomonas koreensis]